MKPRTKLVDLDWLESNFPCMQACPVHTQAGRYVALIAQGRYEEAYRYARLPNPFASICGRVCGHPCEPACRRGNFDAPISIRALKRFLTERYGPESRNPIDLFPEKPKVLYARKGRRHRLRAGGSFRGARSGVARLSASRFSRPLPCPAA